MNKWYSIQARGNVSSAGEKTSAEIFIYGDIGESWWGESVTAAEFVKELAALDVEELTVRINSYGGSVSDGIAIYNAIKRHKAKTTITIDGVAVSIASLIAMAGDTVEAAENALVMIHAPWGASVGNSADMREYADVLDKYAQAMSSSYAAKSGKPIDEIMNLLTDGEDHWFTAAEALDAGFVDAVTEPQQAAASFSREAWAARAAKQTPAHAGKFHAAAAAQPSEKEPAMSDKEKTPTAAPQPAAEIKPAAQPAALDESAIRAAATQDEAKRRDGIEGVFAKFAHLAGMPELMAACKTDTQCTVEAAKLKIVDAMSAGAFPVAGGHVVTLEDETDKQRGAVVASLLVRAGVERDAKVRATMSSNPYRGATLLDLAKASLDRAGVNTRGRSKMEIVAMAFTQGTSDFPVLLENTMHKALLAGYAVAANTWKRFCATGSVSDFRAHSRYLLGSFGNLDALSELGEFKNKTIPDGAKASITAGTKGNLINLSRQAVINDDLGAFVGLASMLGQAAARTVESNVYATLALNSGLGPTLGDGKTLFHADHANIGSAAAISMAAIDADRVVMASQKDVSGNDYLDLMPDVLLVPISLGGTARTINDAQYDPDTANKLQKPNSVRGLFRDIVDSPRLSGTRRYLFANPSIAPVIEVAFLDGMEEPYLEAQNGWNVDGVQQKVRLDFGIGGVGYQGAVTNAGA
jgi:ATP-dependent protease ClpP protease subunit